jgi:hypothetical protein
LISAAAGSGAFPFDPSSAVVPKSYPGTEIRGICCPIMRSMVRTIAISSVDMKV